MNTPVNLESLHNALIANIAAQFPSLKDCGAYPRIGERIETPAIYIELDAILGQDDAGTEQLPVILEWSAYVVRTYKGVNKFSVRKLAAALMAFLHHKRFGQPIGAIQVGDANPDIFEPADLKGSNPYECMRVPFTCSAILGNDVWVDEGELPDTVFAGQAPDVGPGGNYETIVEP